MNSLAGAISELETADRGNHTKYTLTNTLPTIRTSPKCVIMSKAPSMATHAVVQFLPFTSRSGRAFRPPAPASPHSAKLSVSQRNGGGWQRMRKGMSTRARAKAVASSRRRDRAVEERKRPRRRKPGRLNLPSQQRKRQKFLNRFQARKRHEPSSLTSW